MHCPVPWPVEYSLHSRLIYHFINSFSHQASYESSHPLSSLTPNISSSNHKTNQPTIHPPLTNQPSYPLSIPHPSVHPSIQRSAHPPPQHRCVKYLLQTRYRTQYVVSNFLGLLQVKFLRLSAFSFALSLFLSPCLFFSLCPHVCPSLCLFPSLSSPSASLSLWLSLVSHFCLCLFLTLSCVSPSPPSLLLFPPPCLCSGSAWGPVPACPGSLSSSSSLSPWP